MTQNMATIAGRQLRPAFIRQPPFQMSGWPTMTREDAFAFSKNELCCRYWSHVTVTTMKVSNMHHMKVYENAFIFHYAKTCNTWCNEYFFIIWAFFVFIRPLPADRTVDLSQDSMCFPRRPGHPIFWPNFLYKKTFCGFLQFRKVTKEPSCPYLR